MCFNMLAWINTYPNLYRNCEAGTPHTAANKATKLRHMRKQMICGLYMWSTVNNNDKLVKVTTDICFVKNPFQNLKQFKTAKYSRT